MSVGISFGCDACGAFVAQADGEFLCRRCVARNKAARLGHISLTCATSIECTRCGASGSFTRDGEPAQRGAIFTERCGQ